jgi:hypothetical protein
MTLTGPVCDAGRCSQLLAALAEAKVRMERVQVDHLGAILESMRDDAELGLTPEQRATWPVVVVRATRRLLGEVAA